MVEAESGFNYSKFETPQNPWERPEGGRFSERCPNYTPANPLNDAKRTREILLELHNPLIAVAIPVLKLPGKPDSSQPEKKATLWDILLMILEMIINTGKALLSKQAD